MPPIVNALTIVRQALLAALSPIVPSFGGAPACYWRLSPAAAVRALTLQSGALSGLIVVQSQDNGGQADLYLGSVGWTGLITIKASSASLGAAEALRDRVPAALLYLAAPGYAIRADHVRPLDLPLTPDGLHTVATIERIALSR